MSFKFFTWSLGILIFYISLVLVNAAIDEITGIELFMIIIYPGILLILFPTIVVLFVSTVALLVDIGLKNKN